MAQNKLVTSAVKGSSVAEEKVIQLSMAGSYEQWLALKLAQGRREFVESNRMPFLYWKNGASELPRAPGESQRPPQVAFHTDSGDRKSSIPSFAAVIERARVYPVRKAPGRPFPERISIGRAVNCDIVIRDPSISKLHAHFFEVTPTSAELCDAKSSNGTRVHGLVIRAGARRKLEIGDELTFGAVTLEWVDAETLYDLL